MTAALNKSSKRFLKALELVGGIGVAMVGFIIFLRTSTKGASIDARDQSIDNVVVFFVSAVPGFIILVGTFLHTLRRKHWAAALVVIAGAINLFIMAINMRLVFILSGDMWGQYVIFVDLILILITIAATVTNIMVSDRT